MENAGILEKLEIVKNEENVSNKRRREGLNQKIRNGQVLIRSKNAGFHTRIVEFAKNIPHPPSPSPSELN